MNASTDILQNVKLLVEQSAIFFANGNTQASLNLSNEALRLDPQCAKAHFQIFRIYAQTGQSVTGMESLGRAIEFGAENVPRESVPLYINYLLTNNKQELALQVALKHIRPDPTNLEWQEKCCEIYKILGLWDRALDILNNIALNFPQVAKFENTKHVNFSFQNRIYTFENALSFLNKTLEVKISQADLSNNPEYRQARKFAKQGNLAASIGLFNRLLEKDYKSREVIFGLAMTLWVLSQLNGNNQYLTSAKRLINQLEKLEPNSAHVHYYMGSLHLATKQAGIAGYDPALKSFMRAIDLDPEYANAYQEIAWILQSQGQAIESYPYLNKYVQLKEEQANRHPIGRLGIRIITDMNSYAIGHMSDLPAAFVKAKLIGWIPDYKIIWLNPAGRVSNPCLLNYWKKYFEIIEDPQEIKELLPLLDDLELNTAYLKLPDSLTINTRIAKAQVDDHWERLGRAPLMQLDREDCAYGARCLRELGLPDGSWFVGLHVRESGFKEENNNTYNGHRLANIDTFLDAIDLIYKAGGYVVRMGEPSMRKIDPRPGLIEYAHSFFKNDRMDIYLCAQSRFVLGASAGILLVPSLFGTPIIATNTPPCYPRCGSKDIFIPKLFWNKKENRYCTFKEMFSAPIYETEDGNVFIENNLQLIDNTSEEVSAAVIEMLQSLDGKIEYSEEDKFLQEIFRQIPPPEGRFFCNRMPREFLKKYKSLL